MWFLMDVGVGRSTETALRLDGHDVRSMSDECPDAQDTEILRRAVAENRIIITTDRAFGEMVVRRGLPHRGVIVLRMDEATGSEKAEATRWIVLTAGDRLCCHLTVYRDGRLRIGHPWMGPQ